MKIKIISIMLLSLNSLFAQNNFKEIDNFIEKEMQTWHIPNVSIGITNRDSIIYIKEYGSENSKGNYLIGSVSKPFTAIAVMQLAEQGKLDIDKPVKFYLDWFETKNKSVSNAITVRHLLNQTSGLPKNKGFFTPKSERQNEIEQEYRSYLLSINANGEVLGKVHIYCNLNFEILGQLIQKISGLRYAEYVQKYIFVPSEMKHTFADYQGAKNFGLKIGYQYYFGFPFKTTFTYNDNGIASGDIASNTEDMCKFLQMLLKNGKTANDSLLSEGTLKQMQTPFSNRYGMGFSIGDWNGLHSIRHTGLSRNFSSAINILPNENYGIVILTNVNSFYAVRNLMDGVIRRVNNQDKVSYTPYEMYFRYALLLLFLWSLIDFLLQLNKWRNQNFIFKYSKGRKNIFGLLIGIFMALIWLFIVPYYAELPLLKMPTLQPDLGYALLITAALSVGSSLIKYILKSIETMK